MPEIGPQHPPTYRQEIAAPLFQLIRSGESAALIGSASMGKSRLLLFLQRPDVQRFYLGDAAASTWLVPVDCQRLADAGEWGLYELLLTSLTEAAVADTPLCDWLNTLRSEVIVRRDGLLARRYVELATRRICREYGYKLCFILDEFDEVYAALPPNALANLRALRDADRYSVCYLLVLRDHPGRLRAPATNEGFYELVSRSVLGLKPYGQTDAQRVVVQLAERRGHPVAANELVDLLHLSGGHPGLLVALYDLLLHAQSTFPEQELIRWVLAQPQVSEECRKLWSGLAQDEQLALSRLVRGISAPDPIRDLLALKGLVRWGAGDEQEVETRDFGEVGGEVGGEVVFFSPVFQAYVVAHGTVGERTLWLDEAATMVWVEGRSIADLSPLEFDLLRCLYRRLGQVCRREEIIEALHPDETADADNAGSDNRIDSLVRRLRKAVEPAPDSPRYLLTVRGHGYKLVDKPE